MLRIDVQKLQDGPLTVQVDETPHSLELDDDSIFTFPSNLSGTVIFSLVHNDVFVKGSLSITVRAQCVRCLDPVEVTIVAPVHLVYIKRPEHLGRDAETELPEDVAYFDGNIIEPVSDLRDLMLLELPPYPSCEMSSGKRCRNEQLKDGPMQFGPVDSANLSQPSSAIAPAPEADWKAALRNASGHTSRKSSPKHS